MSAPADAAEVELAELNLMDSKLYRGGFPHTVFSQLRRLAPVWWQPISDTVSQCIDPGFWVISKYEDVQEVSRDAELFCSIDGPTMRGVNPELMVFRCRACG